MIRLAQGGWWSTQDGNTGGVDDRDLSVIYLRREAIDGLCLLEVAQVAVDEVVR